MTVWTAGAATLLSWWVCCALVRLALSATSVTTATLATAAHSLRSLSLERAVRRLHRALPAMLALPHAAFAIGLLWLIAPSGWLLRLFSPWLTGFDFPPPWPTSQDPWGLGLIAALVCKEVPFLLWMAATQWQRVDEVKRLQRELFVAQTFGYSPRRSFDAVVWPPLSLRLRWPLLAVWAYGCTVVDVAQIAGAQAPPTLAQQAWQWLQDADVHINALGIVATLLLSVLVLCSSAALWWGLGWRLRCRLRWMVRHPGQAHRMGAGLGLGSSWLHRLHNLLDGFSIALAQMLAYALLALYAAVGLALLVGSVSGLWTFPDLLPQNTTAQAWLSVWDSRGVLWQTLSLALCSSVLSVLLALLWSEAAPAKWQRRWQSLMYVPLILPGLLWVVLLYAALLRLGVSPGWGAVLLGHLVMVLPYVLIALVPAYQDFDRRYAQVAASLRASRWRFLWRIKWPLLKASLASSAAVGFAVSVAQYLPTLYLGGGRINTVTTEAVALAASGQRALTSSYALLQFILPALVFLWAHHSGRGRKFAPQPLADIHPSSPYPSQPR